MCGIVGFTGRHQAAESSCRYTELRYPGGQAGSDGDRSG